MRRSIYFGSRRLSYLESESTMAGPSARLWPGVLVLLHAFPLSAEAWGPQLQDIPPGWRVIAPDLAGFGLSDGHPGTEAGLLLDDYAADLFALLDALEIPTAVIGGLSMGGYITFAAFRRAPHRFRGMMLADTRAGADSPAGRVGRQQMLDVAGRAGVAGVADDMVPNLLGRTTRRERPDVEKRVRDLIAANQPAGVQQAVIRMRDRADATPQLSGIHCPTLIVVGEEDTLTPVEEGRRMSDQVAGAELAVIPLSGHLANLERPAEFNAVLAGFLLRSFAKA
jgi:3-oxoadipate enol-lactonase